MLWYQSWLETRWRFLIGLGLLLCSAAACVFTWPRVVELLPLVPGDMGGELGRQIREKAALSRTYRGYVWSQWFGQSLAQMATLFAILLGTAGVLSQRAGALFTLSLPITRQRLLGVRAATGLAELSVIVFIPSLFLSLLSPAVGERYGLGQALVHSASLFVVAALFFTFAFLLSTYFSDPWRPLLIALVVAFGLALVDRIPGLRAYGVFRVMSAETWFHTGRLPWGGLLASAAVSAGLYYGAARNLARRDF